MTNRILKVVKDLHIPHTAGAVVYPSVSVLNGSEQHLVLGQSNQQVLVTAPYNFFNNVEAEELIELNLRDGTTTLGFIPVLVKQALEHGLKLVSLSSYNQERLLVPQSQAAFAQQTFIRMGFRSIIK